jgi:hypothetical protein
MTIRQEILETGIVIILIRIDILKIGIIRLDLIITEGIIAIIIIIGIQQTTIDRIGIISIMDRRETVINKIIRKIIIGIGKDRGIVGTKIGVGKTEIRTLI